MAAVVFLGPVVVVGVLVGTSPGGAPNAAPLVAAGGVPAGVPAVPAVPAATGSAPTGPSGPAGAQDAYAGWAGEVGARTGIPARALSAYANAEVVLAAERPGCRLTWVTLAGVARVESDHGRYAGRTLRADGRPDRAIIGVPLDGTPGVAAVADTDRGALDGDPVRDRAVGPLQFLPSTWDTYGADGDGDGVAEPQDIDDAAVAAGRYLCASGGDLSTGEGWWRAVLAYNASVDYARDVLAGANTYATRSR
ncbi:lytic transglycosylase domain-containing protein [Actinophytocola sp.]|uniref:lytic transglycosylase domain-containing protein n=1 Tax=Actinophytocola sp. TaxID=1872138 RepID=UPI002ED98D80